MRSILSAAILTVALGVPAAQALTQAELDRFLSVLSQLGCVITPETGPSIEASTGFDQAKLIEVMTFLAQQGALSAPDAVTVRVSAGPCAGSN